MKLFSIPLLLALLLSLFHPVNTQADFLPDGKKQVSSYYRITGWENIEEYILVQPLFGEWDLCPWPDTQIPLKQFYLINEGHKYNFGQESHGNSYYHLAAIKKEYLDQIYLHDGESAIKIYAIECSSDAYKTAIVTNTEIPLSDNVVDENDPLVQVEYTIELGGHDPVTNELLMSVSEPNLQTDSALAQQFVKSLNGDRNTLAVTRSHPTSIREPSATPTSYTQVDESVVDLAESKNSEPVNGLLITNPIWPSVALLSISSVSFLIGLAIGRKKQKIEMTPTIQDEPSHTPEL